MAPPESAGRDELPATALPRRRRVDDTAGGLEQWWIWTTVHALGDHHLYFGLLRLDGSYEELYTGPNLDRLLGGTPPPGADVAAFWESRVEPADLAAYRSCDPRLLAGLPAELVYRVHGLDGVTRWMRAQLQPQQITDEGVHIAGILVDITLQRRAEDDLRAALADLSQANAQLDAARVHALQLASTDPLTGAANRRHAGDVLGRLLAGGGRRVGALLMDIDDFKHVNDAHGHRVGDEVLVEVVSRLHHTVRPEDTVARWGGEEFLVLCPAAQTEESVREIAERIRAAVAARPIATTAGPVALTVSVGAITSPCTADTVDVLLEAADDALLAAKRAGKNRLAVGQVRHLALTSLAV
jgi:diguanylate cyclase (GGDEF)-like protein